MARTRIGSVEVDLTLLTGKFVSGANEAKRAMTGLGAKLREVGNRSIDLRVALAGLAAAGFAAKQIFDLGAAVEETASKFNTVFGDNSGGVNQAIEQFASLAGLSNQAAQEVTANTGAIVQGFGLNARASAALSVEVTRLAGDLASFNNIPVAETARAVQAGLTGEMESLKRLGIAVLDADVKQRALLDTGKDTVSSLTAQEIVMARFALITERAGVQVGDMVRTQETAAARARDLKAELLNLRDSIASALLPVLNLILEGVLRFIKGIQIMGAEAAVVVAKLTLMKESLFGSAEAEEAAALQLHHMMVAADEVKNSIVGLNVEVGTFTGSAENLRIATEEAASEQPGGLGHFAVQTKRAMTAMFAVKPIIVETTGELTALATATGFAANETDRLASAQSRLGAISGGIGFLSSIISPLAALTGPIGIATGGLGAINSIRDAFGGPQQTASSPQANTITLNVGQSRDPISLARDQDWLRALNQSNLNLRAQGA